MPHRLDRTRASICSAAARLIAEDGMTDYTQAKRKALRQLGLPEGTPLPTNGELDDALREWQAVFQDDEQRERIRHLRQKAVELMQILQEFRPYLTGSVLDGTAGRFAEIDLQLFADSAKEVEIFLLNRGIPYSHATPRNDRAEAVLVVESDDAVANLVIYPTLDERIAPKSRDGRPRERARLGAVQNLLAAGSPD
ncbi:hypothetical protein [Azospira restricta]|uniref:Nucleotidyltransferase n=1 Tax=Azospira restricta TaxID=404405 RepID=A0A974Y3S2_9RHOO|nr:hypothetical protein [Azospira restricta]QRJ64035.1 hypothetical protein IWH25_01345 [Azospira restricta]